MTSTRMSAVLLTLAAVAAGQAFAADLPADAPKTREQVRAELAEAKRTGSLFSYTYAAPLNEVDPGRYAAAPKASGLTRAQVEAERQEAKRTGNVFSYTHAAKLNELHPGRYEQASTGAQALSRAQVRADYLAARDAGELAFGEIATRAVSSHAPLTNATGE